MHNIMQVEKKRTTLYLEEIFVKRAMGLNVSRICEIALEEAIRRWEKSPRYPRSSYPSESENKEDF